MPPNLPPYFMAFHGLLWTSMDKPCCYFQQHQRSFARLAFLFAAGAFKQFFHIINVRQCLFACSDSKFEQASNRPLPMGDLQKSAANPIKIEIYHTTVYRPASASIKNYVCRHVQSTNFSPSMFSKSAVLFVTRVQSFSRQNAAMRISISPTVNRFWYKFM